MYARELVCCILPSLLWVFSTSPASADGHNRLPRDHAYQRTLRTWLGSLAEEDYAVELKSLTVPADQRADKEELCRLWVLSRQLPPIGGIRAAATEYMLDAIEADDAVRRPPGNTLAMAWLANWKHPMNPYHGSPAIRRRVLAGAIVDMIMTDGLHELSGGKDWVAYGRQTGIREDRASHSDCLGGTLIWLAYAYAHCLDVAPPNVRRAYAAGLEKLVKRMQQWGPTRLMTDMDLFAAVALAYVERKTNDPALKQICRDYARPLFSDPAYFHPAGYWVDIQGFDASYNGISFYFANWAALASEWDFARKAVDRAHRLKAHLALPEPGGGYVAPSHFSPRTSADSLHDQWNFPCRGPASAMLSDHAQFLLELPDDDTLRSAPQVVANGLNIQIKKSGGKAGIWRESHWTSALNYAHDHYRPDFLKHRRSVERGEPALLRPAFERADNFVTNFDNAFLIARYDDFGVVIHTGSVGQAEADWATRAKWMPRDKIFGFSGGSLSAFWTPDAGAVLLGRRGGAQGAVCDRFEDWRRWPFHVVAGETSDGKVFTSGRILKPRTKIDTNGKNAVAVVSGVIPREYVGQGDVLSGRINYRRTFDANEKRVRITTEVEGDGKDRINEMCELIPIFLHLRPRNKEDLAVEMRIESNGKWSNAKTSEVESVSAVRVKRLNGTIQIRFDRPRRVRLSPEVWRDQYQTRAACRTLLVDLRGPAASPFEKATVSYIIKPIANDDTD